MAQTPFRVLPAPRPDGEACVRRGQPRPDEPPNTDSGRHKVWVIAAPQWAEPSMLCRLCLLPAETWSVVWQSAVRGVTPHCRNGKRQECNEQANDSESGRITHLTGQDSVTIFPLPGRVVVFPATRLEVGHVMPT